MKQLKKLKNFPNYAATPDGLIWSYTTNKFLSPQKHKVGYIYVSIYKNKKQYKKSVHRLVAEAYIDNVDNLSDVDHIDGNKENNCIENLHWVTHQENVKLGWENGLYKNNTAKHFCKKVLCIETNEVYNSATEASKKINLNLTAVAGAIFRNETAGGYHWKYILA